MFKITERAITADDVIQSVEADDAGAIVTFLGTVRNNTGGRQTAYLEYEAYIPMAEKKMADIAMRYEMNGESKRSPSCIVLAVLK